MMGCDVRSVEFIFTSSTKYALELVEAYEPALREGLGPVRVRVPWGQLVGKRTERGKGTRYIRSGGSLGVKMDPKGGVAQ